MTSTSSSFLVLRSRDRGLANSPNANDVRITPSNSYFSLTNIKTFVPHSFQMLYDIPNINQRNNVMVIDNGVMSFPITIIESYYDFTTLAAAIQTELNTLGLGAFTFTWNTVSYKFMMTSAVPVKFTRYPPQKRDLTAVVGMPYDTGLQTTYTGGYADLCYTRDIYVTSTSLNRNRKVIDQCSDPAINNLLMVVPVYPYEEFQRNNAATTGVVQYLLNPRNISYQERIAKIINYNINDSIPSVDITLIDDQGEILYNPYGINGNDWRLSVLIYV